jgi:hypothetical protein
MRLLPALTRVRALMLPSLLAGTVAVLAAVAHADIAGDVLTALKRGIKSEVPEVRARAITDVGRYSAHLDDAQKKQAAALMHKTLRKESDTELRRLLVRAMARVHHQSGWVPVINAALSELDPKVREAARLEVFRGRGDLLEIVSKLIRQEKSASYRAQLALLLGDRRRHDAVPMLIELLGERDRMLVAAAAEALEAISGAAHGFEAQAWSDWHVRWRAERPANGNVGPSVAPEDEEGKEPLPHRTRSLHPEFYGLKLTSKDIVFVVDISGSVGPGGVDQAKRRLLDAVHLLGSDVRMAVLFFAEELHPWNKGQMVLATPDNKEKLAFFLKGLGPGSKTDVFTAFNAGLKILQHRVEERKANGDEAREPATLIAVSDGHNNVKSVPFEVVEEKLDRLDLENTVVHSVVLGGKPSRLMKMLATYGGGHYILVPPK